MDRLQQHTERMERLQAVIAEMKRRWIEKYGCWVERGEYPTMEEEMRREREWEETREANAYIRKIIESGEYDIGRL